MPTPPDDGNQPRTVALVIPLALIAYMGVVALLVGAFIRNGAAGPVLTGAGVVTAAVAVAGAVRFISRWLVDRLARSDPNAGPGVT